MYGNKTTIKEYLECKSFYFINEEHFEIRLKLSKTACMLQEYFLLQMVKNNFADSLEISIHSLSNTLNITRPSIRTAINDLVKAKLFLVKDNGLHGKTIYLNVARNGIKTIPLDGIKTIPEGGQKLDHGGYKNYTIDGIKTIPSNKVVSIENSQSLPSTESYIESYIELNKENKSIVSVNINPKTDDKIQAEISNVSLEKENKLDEKFILDSTKEIILNQENNQVEKKEVSKNTFNQNKTFQQFKSSQNSINQNRTTQDKELEEKIIKRLKDIGLTQIELIIKNYSLQHIQKHLVYFNYQDEQKAYVLYNSIKFDLPAPTAYIRYKRLKALEPLFERWQPVLREYYIPATGLEKLDDALIEMSYKIIDKIDDIQSYKSSLIDGKEKKGSLYNSAIKFFKNILAKLDYNEILEIFNEYISNKNYRSWHYKLRYFSDDEVRKYLNSVKQIRSYSELPEH